MTDPTSDFCCHGLTDVSRRVGNLEEDVREIKGNSRDDVRRLHEKMDRGFSRIQWWFIATLGSITAGLLYIIIQVALPA